jgi:hypothetical protein
MLPRALRAIADELERRRAQVLDEVEGLSQRQADWRPAHDQWSVGEVLHHLVIAEGIAGKMVSVALKRVADAGSLLPYPAEVDAFAWRAPRSDDRWLVRVPEPAAPTHGQPVDGLREAFTRQRALTEKVLQRLTGIDPRAITAVHPLIGDMNAAEWYRFCEYHMRIHLRQMKDVKAAPAFPGYE